MTKHKDGLMTINDASSLAELGDALLQTLRGTIHFDRLNIGLLDGTDFVDAYVYGQNVPGRKLGHRRPLAGTVVEAAIANDGGIFVGDPNPDALLARFPNFGPVIASGINAMQAVIVYQKAVPIVAIVLGATDPHAFNTESIARVRECASSVLSSLERLGTLSRVPS